MSLGRSFRAYEAVIQYVWENRWKTALLPAHQWGMSQGGGGQAKKTPLQAACLYAVAAVMS